jgi:hypothetical protein
VGIRSVLDLNGDEAEKDGESFRLVFTACGMLVTLTVRHISGHGMSERDALRRKTKKPVESVPQVA